MESHPESMPSTVIHHTVGVATDSDPRLPALALTQAAGQSGNVLLYTCQHTASGIPIIELPDSPQCLPNAWTRAMFALSSLLPEWLFASAGLVGTRAVRPGTRGYVLNSSAEAFMDVIGGWGSSFPTENAATGTKCAGRGALNLLWEE
jgi:hypothetical protein